MNISSISSLATAVTQPTEARQPAQNQKALIQAVRAVNAAEMFGQENEVTFIIDRATKIAVVRIVNKATGEVVQQIPNLAEESSGSQSTL
jgi:uncharacterized FlaG/YvyC family protein